MERAGWYGRPVRMTSKASTTDTMRAPSGICVAAEPVRVAGAVEVLVMVADDEPDVLPGVDVGEDARPDLGMRAHDRRAPRRSAR